MGLPHDHAGLAAVTLTRTAAKENEGQANRLPRQHFAALASHSSAAGQSLESLLDAIEVDELDDCG